jgi:hypothetical protein
MADDTFLKILSASSIDWKFYQLTAVITSPIRKHSLSMMALGFMLVMDIPVRWLSSKGDWMIAASSNSF